MKDTKKCRCASKGLCSPLFLDVCVCVCARAPLFLSLSLKGKEARFVSVGLHASFSFFCFFHESLCFVLFVRISSSSLRLALFRFFPAFFLLPSFLHRDFNFMPVLPTYMTCLLLLSSVLFIRKRSASQIYAHRHTRTDRRTACLCPSCLLCPS